MSKAKKLIEKSNNKKNKVTLEYRGLDKKTARDIAKAVAENLNDIL